MKRIMLIGGLVVGVIFIAYFTTQHDECEMPDLPPTFLMEITLPQALKIVDRSMMSDSEIYRYHWILFPDPPHLDSRWAYEYSYHKEAGEYIRLCPDSGWLPPEINRWEPRDYRKFVNSYKHYVYEISIDEKLMTVQVVKCDSIRGVFYITLMSGIKLSDGKHHIRGTRVRKFWFF